jgi:mannose-6-phosphate isomerase-like protein (cupin superfamily)
MLKCGRRRPVPGKAEPYISIFKEPVFGQRWFPDGLQCSEAMMPKDERRPSIKNVAETPWQQFPNHFGGALSKPLVMPETMNSKHLDYRISMYQPMAHVAKHSHKVQEQVYHVLEGEGLMVVGDKAHVVRKHDVIYLPPGVEHSINNTGLVDLVFIVATSPVTDDAI